MPEQRRKHKVADFVSKIVKDPNAPPNTLLLQGYLGDSSEEGHVRLYLDPQLTDYVEIPEAAILHTQEVPDSPLGETYVWIDADAELTHGKAGPQRLKAKFLEGRIQQQYLGGTAGAAAPVAPAPTPPYTVWPTACHSIGIACIPTLLPEYCPTRYPIACHSRQIIQCHTHAPYLCPISVPVYTCYQSQVAICVSKQVICPTKVAAICGPASGGLPCVEPGPGPEQFATTAAIPPPTASPQLCPSAVDACPTRLCPSVAQPCQSQLIPCPSWIEQCQSVPVEQCPSAVDACPSRLCPSLAQPCPSVPIYSCPSRVIVQCPSAIDACPSKLCPSLAQPCISVPVYHCPSRIIIQCPSAVDACPTRICQSVPVLQCPSRIIAQCPSAVDACPSRLCGSAIDPCAI